MRRKKVVITTGDPAGCGPYITLKAIENLGGCGAEFYVVADEKILSRFSIYRKASKRINLVSLNTAGIDKVKAGFLSKLSGRASINYLNKALEVMDEYGIKRLVTAPLSKEAAQLIRPGFSGQSEYLASHFKRRVEMMMVSPKLKTILFTRHIPFKEVPDFISETNLKKTFELVLSSLRALFKIRHPKVAVCALNPHAGINTFLGVEEKTIHKAIRAFSANFSGPYPPDSLFIKSAMRRYDCIVALYHDQGMIPFKLLSMKEGVNLTLGLPIIRASPAHGVAFDVMRRREKPFASSMAAAIKLAMKLNID